MEDDPRQEIAEPRARLVRIQKLCEVHRKLGENTEFEIRELKHHISAVKDQMANFLNHYAALTHQRELDPAVLEHCNGALESLEKLVTSL